MSKKSKRDKKDKKPLKIFAWLDSHHKIEMQLGIFIVSLITMGSSVVYSNWRYGVDLYNQNLQVSKIGITGSFSKSGTSVQVSDIWLSPDQKTAYVGLTFGSMSSIGIHANDYEFYLADDQHRAMQYPVQGQFYLYTPASQGILVLKSNQPIPSEYLQLFIMNQKTVPTVDQSGIDATVQNGADAGNTEFGNYDVAQVPINPGASNIASSVRISPKDGDLVSMYQYVFGVNTIQSVQQAIQSDQAYIKANKAATAPLIERLQNNGFTVPKPPIYYDDDWKPSQTVDPNTGRDQGGKLYTSTMIANGDVNLPDADIPSTLKSSKGIKMGDPDSGNASNDSPLGEWQQLQSIWNNIGQKRIDMNVTQQVKLYELKKQANEYPLESSIGNTSRVKQLGATKS